MGLSGNSGDASNALKLYAETERSFSQKTLSAEELVKEVIDDF